MHHNLSGKKGGHPRFLFLILAAIAISIALPLVFESATNTARADHGLAPALTARLTGDPIADVTPRGSASYFVDASATPDPVRVLFVTVSNINLPNGTQLGVSLNSAPIGTITIERSTFDFGGGHGYLRLSTTNGDTVPDVMAGDTLTVGPAPTAGSTTYLSGTFAAPTPFPTPSHTPWQTPSHTPFPTPSHTPWPTPSSTPLPPRAFAARLNGANEVPPVTTDGQGFGFVALNSAETQIRVCIGYRGLSSDATAITINGPATTSENGPVIFTLTLPTNSFGFASQAFDVTPEQVTDLRAGSWYFQVSTANNAEGEIRGQINSLTPHGGHHVGGGGVADDSGDAQPNGRSYIPAPFDFDGDGITDIASFQTSSALWYITQSSDGRTVAYE